MNLYNLTFIILGECTINENRSYGLVSKLNFMTKYTKASRATFIKEMEGYKEDISEKLVKDISTCFSNVGTVPYPTNVQGQLAQDLVKSHSTAINQILVLHCPLMSLDSLLPNSIDLVRVLT